MTAPPAGVCAGTTPVFLIETCAIRRKERSMRASLFRLGSLAGAAALVATLGSFSPGLAQADGTPFQVDAFTSLQIEGGGHAIITIGEPASVTVSGTQKDIDQLQVQVWFGTLEIEPENEGNNTKSDLVYHITVPSLTQIELEGSVTAEVDGLTVDSLEIEAEDSAKIELTKLAVSRLQVQVENNASVTVAGTADQQDIEIQDSATYDALELDSRSAEIQGEGSSTSRVRISEQLSGQLEDSATVEYITESGNVSISSEDSSTLTQLPFKPLSA
jgi:hypothetical protein